MNLHKLKELEESPLRENRSQYLKRIGVNPWDYEDKHCRFHRRDYGQAYSFAEDMIEKNIGKDAKTVISQLKNDPRYKHRYFFKRGIDSALKQVRDKTYYYRWYYSDYFIDKSTNVICKREAVSSKKKVPKPRTYYEYIDGTVIKVRKGIHYFKLSDDYHTQVWDRNLKDFTTVYVRAKYWQLSKYWLKFYNLKNEY